MRHFLYRGMDDGKRKKSKEDRREGGKKPIVTELLPCVRMITETWSLEETVKCSNAGSSSWELSPGTPASQCRRLCLCAESSRQNVCGGDAQPSGLTSESLPTCFSYSFLLPAYLDGDMCQVILKVICWRQQNCYQPASPEEERCCRRATPASNYNVGEKETCIMFEPCTSGHLLVTVV